jgi:acetyl-CoA C-acetyltransferase
MRNIVICEPVRTPVGRYGGSLKNVAPHTLGAAVIGSLVARTGIAGEDVDDVIFGNCYPNAEAPALGRVAALDAGLPVTVPGIQVDRRCGSGLMAVLYAAMQIQTGASDLVIAGGAESMSNAAFYSSSMRWGARGDGVMLHDSLARGRVTAGGAGYPVPGGMLETAENLCRSHEISRADQDALALESHRRAVAAQDAGVFTEEIVAVTTPAKRGDVVVDRDEHPRPGLTMEALAALKPIRQGEDPAARVTAGNASGQNDAAAACIVTHEAEAERLGLRPLVRLVSWGMAGVEPKVMGIGPVPATQVALKNAGLTLAQIDLVELNEAFAAQVLACTKEWGFAASDFDRLNVHGSGIALGHPVGATGVRMLATLAREMVRRQARYGLETMCIGGGQGLAAVFEVVAGR